MMDHPAFTPDTKKYGCIASRLPEAFVDIIGLAEISGNGGTSFQKPW
jgi:hypothetical protein